MTMVIMVTMMVIMVTMMVAMVVVNWGWGMVVPVVMVTMTNEVVAFIMDYVSLIGELSSSTIVTMVCFLK